MARKNPEEEAPKEEVIESSGCRIKATFLGRSWVREEKSLVPVPTEEGEEKKFRVVRDEVDYGLAGLARAVGGGNARDARLSFARAAGVVVQSPEPAEKSVSGLLLGLARFRETIEESSKITRVGVSGLASVGGGGVATIVHAYITDALSASAASEVVSQKNVGVRLLGAARTYNFESDARRETQRSVSGFASAFASAEAGTVSFGIATFTGSVGEPPR